MPVQVTNLGPNSAQLYYTNTETLADIIEAVHSFMLTHGWALHDAFHAQARVYKALNADGITYKYVMLDYRSAGAVLMTLYDNWNEVTHASVVPPAISSNDTQFNQRLSVGSSGYINIFASPRWLALYNRPSDGVYGDPNLQSASIIVEYARDNPEDTSASSPYIPVLFGTVASLVGRFPLHTSYQSGQVCFTQPRNRTGSYTQDAMAHNAIATICGRSVPEYSPASNSFVGLWQCLPNKVNPWNQKNYAFTMYAACFSPHGYRGIMGRLYGLKAITVGAGLGMDTIMIPVDGEYFHSPDGTPMQHYVLGDSKGDRLAIPA